MPWFMIGGLIGGVLVVGSSAFLLRRSRTRKGLTYDNKFLIIHLSKASMSEEGKDVFYVLSEEGRVVRITLPQDNTHGSKGVQRAT